MAHTLKLVYGSTSVTISSGDYQILSYPMQTADAGAESIAETVTLLITASSLANLQADIAAINRMFERARQRQDGRDYVPVVAEFQGSGESLAWWSEIYDGRVIMPEDALGADWANQQFEVGVIWERSAFWEAKSWINVPLTNGNGTDVTTGLRIFNCCDGVGFVPNQRYNYVDIDGVNDVLGDLPAPVEISFDFPTGATDVYMGMATEHYGHGLITPLIEAEDTTDTVGAINPSAASSDGNFLAHSHPGTAPYVSDAWILQDLTSYSGETYRLFIRWATAPAASAVQVGLKVEVSPLSMTQELMPYAYTGGKMLEPFGDVTLPPGRLYVPWGAIYENKLTFLFYKTSSVTLSWDYAFFLPLEQYRHLGTSGTSLGGYTLTYREGLMAVRYIDSLAVITNPVNPFDRVHGDGIWLKPGVNQRLFFLFGPAVAITAGTLVTMKYKPRRSAL